MDRYVYHQLRSGEQRVRLLNLSPGSNSDDIQCDILDYKINLEKPFGMYEALSYRWGNPSDSRRILVRDQADTAYQYLDVTANLHAALHHMRDPSLHRTLWIDAVCINQSDLEERGQQVQFMASVYARACQVVVWLGESPENERDLQESREAFELIRRVARNPVDIPSTMPKAVLNLLRKEWFTRIWVLQEIAAARSFSIMSGEEEIFGTTFVRGIQQLLPKVFESDPSLHTYITVTIELMALAPPSAYKHEPPALDIAPLGDLIEMFHTYGATDQRDKIYALLGLTSDHRLTHSLQPNYEKSWAKVLNELIEHLLGKHVESLTWDDKDSAVITASGCTVGYVLSVSEGMIQIESKDFYRYSE
ncbi:HET-domain-containing protein, partial [Ophiobolus disseminans]